MSLIGDSPSAVSKAWVAAAVNFSEAWLMLKHGSRSSSTDDESARIARDGEKHVLESFKKFRELEAHHIRLAEERADFVRGLSNSQDVGGNATVEAAASVKCASLDGDAVLGNGLSNDNEAKTFAWFCAGIEARYDDPDHLSFNERMGRLDAVTIPAIIDPVEDVTTPAKKQKKEDVKKDDVTIPAFSDTFDPLQVMIDLEVPSTPKTPPDVVMPAPTTPTPFAPRDVVIPASQMQDTLRDTVPDSVPDTQVLTDTESEHIE